MDSVRSITDDASLSSVIKADKAETPEISRSSVIPLTLSSFVTVSVVNVPLKLTFSFLERNERLSGPQLVVEDRIGVLAALLFASSAEELDCCLTDFRVC